MKNIFLICCLSAIVYTASAQKKQNVYFFKNNGKEVKVKDSADYIRVIQEPDSGEVNFVVQEFYNNGTRKTLGKVSAFEPRLVYEGIVMSYHKNGKKKSAISFEKNRQVGMGYFYFENGKMHKQIAYLPKKSDELISEVDGITPRLRLIFEADSLGKVAVQDGNGHLISTTKEGKDSLVEEGDYKDGFKDGVWKGLYASGKGGYTESYADGKFVSGVSTIDNQTYPYTVLESPPRYKNDMKAFYAYVGRTVRYPRDAVENKITGSVIVAFVVEKDGSITDVKVQRSVYPSLDEEAVKVLKLSPKWVPGMQRGLPVKVKYNIPISFRMTR